MLCKHVIKCSSNSSLRIKVFMALCPVKDPDPPGVTGSVDIR